MVEVLASKLSDATNPGTAPVAFAAILSVLIVLGVWRALIPQALSLLRVWRAGRRHRRAMLKHSQKRREELPPGQN